MDPAPTQEKMTLSWNPVRLYGDGRFKVIPSSKKCFRLRELSDSQKILCDTCSLGMAATPTVGGAGPGAPAVEDLAAAAGTIAYEILVGVGPRVPRLVVDDDA